MELELVNLTQAKALKELGFDQINYEKWYTILDNIEYTYKNKKYQYKIGQLCTIPILLRSLFADEFRDKVVAMPSLELAAKYLRRYKNLIILLEIEDDYGLEYIYKIYSINEETNYIKFLDCGDRGEMLSYEQALSKGINRAIEILKNNEKSII